jgi:hypothetical protein
MPPKTLYESDHPRITVTLEENGDVVLNRADKYMRNPDVPVPAFVSERRVLININEEK